MATYTALTGKLANTTHPVVPAWTGDQALLHYLEETFEDQTTLRNLTPDKQKVLLEIIDPLWQDYLGNRNEITLEQVYLYTGLWLATGLPEDALLKNEVKFHRALLEAHKVLRQMA